MRPFCHPDSLLGRLRVLPDRRRQARQYPLPSILAALMLGALNGQPSGLGAWTWAREPWGASWQALGFRSPHCPVYSTVWTLLQRLEAAAVDHLVSPWLEEVLGHPPGGVSVDGPTFTRRVPGRRRGDLPGLTLVAMAHQQLGSVVGHVALADGAGDVPAALAVLRAAPLAGRGVLLDAGLLSAEATQGVTAHGGDDVGVVKDTMVVVKAVLDEWVPDAVVSPLRVAHPRRTDGGCPLGEGPWTEGHP